MNEEAVVDDYVKAFAEHIQCDPELAQELYFKHKVTEALDNEQKASVRRELSALQLVSNNLDRAAKAFNGLSLQDDHLRNTLRIQGLDLQKQIEDFNKALKDDIAFFKASIAEGTSGTASDQKANKVAEFVASVFLKIDRPVSFGTTANDSGEPSTPVNAGLKPHQSPDQQCTIWQILVGVKVRHFSGCRFVHRAARRSAPTEQRSCAGLWSNRGAVFAL